MIVACKRGDYLHVDRIDIREDERKLPSDAPFY
jgi:hypothetical protein